jgi:hypothetical protein
LWAGISHARHASTGRRPGAMSRRSSPCAQVPPLNSPRAQLAPERVGMSCGVETGLGSKLASSVVRLAPGPVVPGCDPARPDEKTHAHRGPGSAGRPLDGTGTTRPGRKRRENRRGSPRRVSSTPTASSRKNRERPG